MNFTALYLKLFGTTQFLGIDMGFWIGMGVVALIVVIENILFWSMKTKKKMLSKDDTK